MIHSSKVDCQEAKNRDCNAVVWSEQGRGYALVADNCCASKTSASIDAKVLKNIHTAVLSGDFSSVSACATTREALKKLTATSGDFCESTRRNVLSAAENDDFSKVAACAATRENIKKAIDEFKERSLQTALNTNN